ARISVGNEDSLLIFQMKSYLEIFKELDSKIDLFDQRIKSEFEQIQTHILSIPGIGITSAAAIFAEIGNIARFPDSGKLLAFAGLEPSTIQSGEAEHNGKMVKHGSSHLRYVLMNVAEYSLIHNPVLYDYYRKKRDEGKNHRVALSHVAKKIVRIIYHLETHDIDFDSSKLR
ncbi:MAG: IS110 family transposase, partial [Solobacterium sp.]|nr:IS110 family transposase [Solobacterium sp.]